MFRSRVITPTASKDKGTGDPMPISCPVSRGNNFGVSVPGLAMSVAGLAGGNLSGFASG